MISIFLNKTNDQKVNYKKKNVGSTLYTINIPSIVLKIILCILRIQLGSVWLESHKSGAAPFYFFGTKWIRSAFGCFLDFESRVISFYVSLKSRIHFSFPQSFCRIFCWQPKVMPAAPATPLAVPAMLLHATPFAARSATPARCAVSSTVPTVYCMLRCACRPLSSSTTPRCELRRTPRSIN
jgi:hypothetical protein